MDIIDSTLIIIEPISNWKKKKYVVDMDDF